jgi:uncharacterized membrane protein
MVQLVVHQALLAVTELMDQLPVLVVVELVDLVGAAVDPEQLGEAVETVVLAALAKS